MKEKQNSICLRPHHGMCLAYFEGRGYSREFAEHMGKILDIMERDARVSLTVGGDVICSACPNLKGQVCVTADQVAERYFCYTDYRKMKPFHLLSLQKK